MRIALLYPPPWKIAEPGAPPFPPGEGPPGEYREGDLDGDFYQTPYGLFTLGAQALRAGHQVKVINLSAYAWTRIEEVVARLDADLFGMSCWTANRRGVALVAELIRAKHPKAHILVGGPHATPLPVELLEHHPAIDTVAVGESELTFLELAARLAVGRSTKGTAGTVYRDEGRIVRGPARASVADLDELASPHDYFDTHIVMTSRGCPWACTFCGAESQWGRGFRANTAAYTLDALQKLVARLPVKMVAIKDDTFTTSKKRVMALCQGIVDRKIDFVWSCDTRVDVLDEELLRAMRLAGCQRLSLGVESGSAEILKNIDKKITKEEILASTALAKRYGIEVRYFMMLGNRGETAETFEETLAFLEEAQPHAYLFSCLSIYPGTRDYEEAVSQGWLGAAAYFDGDFQELKMPFDATDADTVIMNTWFHAHNGLQEMWRPGVAECQATLALLGEHHLSHLDLAGACYAVGDLDGADRHAKRALELGHPLPGLALNYLACIAVKRGDIDGMMRIYTEAAQRDPQHFLLIKNVATAKQWFRDGGAVKKLPLDLVAGHDFKLLERTAQPTLPGPLAPDFGVWGEALKTPWAPPTMARAGSQAGLGSRRRLKVV